MENSSFTRARRLLLLLALAMLTPQTIWGYDFKVDGIYYKCGWSGDSTVSVTSSGESTQKYTGSVIIPPNVTYKGKTYLVISIGEYAFENCTGLRSVEIPNSVTSIEYRAFVGCTGLANVEIPNSVTSIASDAFYCCSGLTSVTIPNSVTSIGEYAFYGCSGLTSVTIPNSVTSIGGGAFNGTAWYNNQPDGLVYAGLVAYEYKGTMPSRTSITIKDGTLSITGSCFSGCSGLTSVTIPNSVSTIGWYAFSGCTGISSVTIPNSVTSIGNYAFNGCSSLTSVTIGNSVTYIGSCAFKNCSALIAVNIYDLKAWCNISFSDNDSNPLSIAKHLFLNDVEVTDLTITEGVEKVSSGAFDGCSALISVTIPASVTSIGSGAFSGCTGLTKMVVASGNTKYDSRNNCNAIIETSQNLLIAGCPKTTIPNTVTAIGNSAFSRLTNLTSVTIPNSVTSIRDNAFRGCSGLTSVVIPNSVTYIGSRAFSSCTSLKSVSIPSVSGVYVDYDAFKDCSGLNKVGVNSIDGVHYSLKHWYSIRFGNRYSNPLYYAHNLYSGSNACTRITIPDTVTTIDSYTFCGIKLSQLTIPKTVASLSIESFWDANIGDIVVAEGNPKYDSRNYCNAIIETDKNCLLLGGVNTIIPTSVERIGSNAFGNNDRLVALSIPENIKEIGSGAFSGCLNIELLIWKARNCKGNGDISTAKLTDVLLGDSVETLPDNFVKGAKITSLVIPKSITSIGQEAFKDCNDLAELEWNAPIFNISGFPTKSIRKLIVGKDVIKRVDYERLDSLYELEWNAVECREYICDFSYNISKARIGQGVELLPGGFLSGSKIKSMVIPNSVKAIGNRAFYGCNELLSVNIPDSVRIIDDYSFADCSKLCDVSIGKSVVGVERYAFCGCKNLQSLVLPNSLKYIVWAAFDGCTHLSDIVIPETVEHIGCHVFAGSNWKKSLPDGLTYVGKVAYAYKGDIPDNGIIEIKEGTKCILSDCFKSDMIIPNSVIYIGNTYPDNYQTITKSEWYKRQPDGFVYAGKVACGLKGETNQGQYTLEDGTKGIASFAFLQGGYSGEIPKSVVAIGEYAFLLSGRTEVKIPENVEYIGSLAFSNEYLRRIEISRATKHIGGYAFQSHSLKEVKSHIVHPELVNVSLCAFDSPINSTYTNATLYVPKGTIERYRTTMPWKFFEHIVEFDDPVTGDADGNYVVDIDDVNIIINIMIRKAESETFPAADVNEDGVVDVDDLNKVINIMLRKE